MPPDPIPSPLSFHKDAVLEHIEMCIKFDRTAEFEAAYEEGRHLRLDGVSGPLSVRLLRCVEFPVQYLHVVEFSTLDSHFAFRGTPPHQAFLKLIEPFRDPDLTPRTGMLHYRWVSTS